MAIAEDQLKERAARIVIHGLERIIAASLALGEAPKFHATMASLQELSRNFDVLGMMSASEPAPAIDKAGGPELVPAELAADELVPAEIAADVLDAIGVVLGQLEVETHDANHALFRVRGTVADDAPAETQDLARFLDDLGIGIALRAASDKEATLGLWASSRRSQGRDQPQTQPIALSFEEERISLDLDLAATRAMLSHLSSTFDSHAGDSTTAANLTPEVKLLEMQGRVRLSLKALSAAALEISGSIVEDTRISLETPDGQYTFGMAATEPTWSLWFDGSQGGAGLSLDLGPCDIRFPYAAMVGKPEVAGEVDLHVAGLSADVQFHDGDEELTINNVSLGRSTSTMMKGDQVLVRCDLNANRERRADLLARPSPDGKAVMLRIKPGLNLALEFNLGTLREHVTRSIPDFLVNETYTVNVSGTGGAVLQPVGKPGGNAALMVRKGKLTLKATGAASPLQVAQGHYLIMCDPSSPRAAEAHPLLRLLDTRKNPT